MENVKLWFELLLWIIGSLTAIAAFACFYKPMWKIFGALEELTEKINTAGIKTMG